MPDLSRFGRRLAAMLAAGAIASALEGAEPVSPPVVEYTIEANLDAATHAVDGRERLVWRNPSADPVGELRFHLYLNAFKNNRSTFIRESGGQLRGDKLETKPEYWGWIDISSFKTAGGVDLKPSMRFLQPDGNDASDQTVLAVTLPAPVPPHGEIALAIAFRSKLPRVFARTGYVRDFHLVGQWFPKIGVYEPAGMRQRAAGGWNCHAFHADSEFYADYGRYDVTLRVPANFVVGATGKRVSEEKSGGRATYRYTADDVHDFAWTADPRYEVHEFRFDPRSDIPAGWTALAASQLGMTPEAIALKPVSVRLLLQPGHERARDRYVQSTRAALSFYGLWFGAYPYETLTVVDPPEDGLGAGGMEYPTFITGEAYSWVLRWPFKKVRFVEDVNIHEFGHQYFYGMVGSNEFEESWLDEGLNTDAEYRAMELAYGPRVISLPGGIGADMYSIAHGAYSALPNLDPIRRHAWGFASGASYGVNSYMKVGLFMAQLRHDLGDAAFARAERAFFRQWSFRHPSTADFFGVFEKVSGRDLSTYRRNLVEGLGRLDWSVVSARTDREPKDSGVFERAGGRVTYEKGRQVRPKGEKDKKGASGEKKTFPSEVVFGNRGDWLHGAKARLVFEDGKVLDRDLPENAQWVRLRIRYTSKLAWAAVDPDRSNTWDWNRGNDSLVLGRGKGLADTAGSRAAVKYFAKAAYLMGLFLQAVWTLA